MLRLIRRAMKVKWNILLPILRQMKQESGRGYVDLFKDMYALFTKEGYTWLNYPTFGFHINQDKTYRSTYLSEYGDNGKIRELCMDPAISGLVEDKGIFNKFFKELIGRDAIDLRWDSLEKFEEIIAKHPVLFFKSPDGKGGESMIRQVTSEIKDPKALYERLREIGNTTVEEGLTQHPQMSLLSPNSVNTIRTGTCVDPEGNAHVIYMVLRCSVGDQYMDNGSLGGIWTRLDDGGKVIYPFYTNVPDKMLYFDRHPVTGFEYKDFQVPMVDEVKELAKKAALLVPESPYIGWDIAITEERPVIIESNPLPSVELFQVYTQQPSGLGMVSVLEEKLGIKLR